jgi:uncharacterized protein (DUF433 family)
MAYSVGCSVASTSSGGWNLALADVDAVMGSRTSRSREADVMELESYFDFLAPDDIRVKGTRIGIETILYEYIHRSQSAEVIAARYPSLTLEQVYATITYYLRYRPAVHAYLEDWLEHGRQVREAQERNLPPVVVRVRALAAQRQRAETPAP